MGQAFAGELLFQPAAKAMSSCIYILKDNKAILYILHFNLTILMASFFFN